MSQWYKSREGRRRLELEIIQMERNRPDFQLYCDDRNGDMVWCGSLQTHRYSHRDVRLVYDWNHPYEPMKVYIFQPKLPVVNIHIHEDGSICYILGEWTPEWTAYTVLLTTMRWLDDFYSGRM